MTFYSIANMMLVSKSFITHSYGHPQSHSCDCTYLKEDKQT